MLELVFDYTVVVHRPGPLSTVTATFFLYRSTGCSAYSPPLDTALEVHLTALQVPTEREQRIASELRQRALHQITLLGEDAAADCLSLMPSGVRSLKARSQWSLETAFRVADALGLDTTRSLENSLHD